MNRISGNLASLAPRALLALLCAAGLAAGAAAETLRVRAGESISRAIARAAPGSVIEVEPGVYHEALVVDTPGITLRGVVRGSERPVLDGRGKLNDGVIASASPFAISGFGVRRYKGNGVTTQGVDGALFRDLVVDDTGLYGVYPVQSRNITVVHCTVTRVRDAGIYVGESERALVAYNEVHRNVAGIEIENSNDTEVRDNLVYDNTAGILVFVLPGKVLKEARRNRVHSNWVVRNNTRNFGDPESTVGSLPAGIGILVMGADDSVVEGNWVKQNRSVGIGLIRLAEEDAAQDPEQEPLADRNRIGFNYLSQNGDNPHRDVKSQYGGGGDFAWDGSGRDNCADLSDAVQRVGAPLRGCPDSGSPDSPLGPGAGPVDGGGANGSGALAAAPAKRAKIGAAPANTEGADAVVRLRGMRFVPKHISVRPGGTVAWVNDDAVAHTVTSGSGTRVLAAPLASPFLARGDVYRHSFAKSGVFEYLCLPHLDQAPMRGATVTVAP